MTDAEAIELIETLARLHRMSVVDVANLARGFAMAEMDPLPIDEMEGEELIFASQRVRREPFGALPDDYDFDWINSELPDPHALVDLFLALDEYKRDCQRCANLLKRPHLLSIDRLRAISKNQLGWSKFMAVRHPNATMRGAFAKHAVEIEAATAANAERAEDHLRRRGVVPWGR